MKIETLNKTSKMNNILCLGKGTKVLMKDSIFKAIENVLVGDEIISYNFDLKSTKNILVEKRAKSFHSVICLLRLENGTTIECTTDHPIWIKNKGWCSHDFKETISKYNIQVQQLEEGDECLTYIHNQLGYLKISSIETIVGDFEMFDISGGEQHCFFANNILVHDENLMSFSKIYENTNEYIFRS